MVFDPMKFYDDGQRRQKRYDSLVPVFVVAIVLLVVFGAGFVAYQRSHVKPKPEQWAYRGRPCKGTDCREAIAASTATDQPFMSQCPNGGWYVTNLADCKTPGFSGSFMVPLGRPRKHKRKAVCVAVNEYIDGLGDGDFWMIPGTMIWFPTHRECNKFWANPIPLWAGAHPIVWNKPDCLPGGCDHILQPVIGNNEDLVRAEKAAEYDQLALDHSGDFYDNVFVPGGECTDRERYRELQCQMGGKCLLRNLDSKNWCPVVEWHIDPPAKPDCKMPADVDVCPQTLDPKAVDDKKAKP